MNEKNHTLNGDKFPLKERNQVHESCAQFRDEWQIMQHTNIDQKDMKKLKSLHIQLRITNHRPCDRLGLPRYVRGDTFSIGFTLILRLPPLAGLIAAVGWLADKCLK